jgi:hypothetical protein
MTPDSGGGIKCSTPSDCPTVSDACLEASCQNQRCGVAKKTAGTKLDSQVAGDCHVSQCDGQGATEIANDNSDLPVDGNECTADVCTAGVPSNPAKMANAACGANGALKCTSMGQCVSCLVPADCGADTECQAKTCVAGVCGVDNKPQGLALAAQTAGNCKVSQCNGSGQSETVDDNSDVPVDTNQCTNNICTAGVPSNPVSAAGTMCTQTNGTQCDGSGACVQCLAASDCPGTDSECQRRTCTTGMCGVSFTPNNTATTSQTASDCKKNVCNGAGQIVSSNDNADVPNDNNVCTVDSCMSGMPLFTNGPAGTSCGAMQVCNAIGQCTGCNVASDCAGTDDDCKARRCTNNVCAFAFTSANTAVSMQTANDCKKRVCDGVGNTVTQNDNTDVPLDDLNQCTGAACAAGIPQQAALDAGTPCVQDGGIVCNAAAACVGCLSPSMCPGTDTECRVRTCTAGGCGFTNTPAGTLTTAQVAGDCQRNQCDGNGNTVSVAVNSDVPVDDGNQCTSESCNMGAPVHPVVPVNTMCNQNGGTLCSAAGTCGGCNTASQCPGMDTACQTRTCLMNTCGVSNVPAGTATPTQVTGDCQQNQCNGSGAIVSVALNSDAPADDGNQCTSESCNMGAPVHPVLPVNSVCSQNGGTLCSVAGTCVGCNTASQCPGMDTACQTRTCLMNTCGVSNAMPGTVIATQVSGDCQQNQCNGSGAIVSVALNSDAPADDGNQCTSESCNMGAPVHPIVPVNTACNQNGGSLCSAAGTCVGCTLASQCPGTDTACQTRTCVMNACGVSNVVAGTATPTQVSGDCQQNQCNGSGSIVSVALNTDAPADDGNQCTTESCNIGMPVHPPAALNLMCNQNGGIVCSAVGTCVPCNTTTQCPGSDTECQSRTCNLNACGIDFAPNTTVTSAQTAGNCQQNRCSGAGAIVSVVDTSDVPADDGNQCTSESCNMGTPIHPSQPANTACNQSGGIVCTGSGACVACNTGTQCPGSDTDCQSRTCVLNACGVNNAMAGTVTTSQTAGDCQQIQCNGSGGAISVAANLDIPADDGIQCTSESCNMGAPEHPPVAVNTACTQSGGSFCSAAGTCVVCNVAAQCPGIDTECQTRTCLTNACGLNFAASGTVTALQSANDCKENQCNGSGAIAAVNKDADIPLDDGNQCTAQSCSMGSPIFPFEPPLTVCTQMGGTQCDGAGVCVSVAPAPTVVSTNPADAATSVSVATTVAVTFSIAMDPTTLTVQSSGGACSGSVQVSSDLFATCLGISSIAMTVGNTVATLTPAPGLSFGIVYKIRVTTTAKSAAQIALASTFTTPTGFTTAVDGTSGPGVVISQVYGSGGNAGATYNADFVELHNRGTTTVNIGGWSIQYASSAGNFGNTTLRAALPIGVNNLLPGQYYLVQMSTPVPANGAALSADFVSLTNVNMATGAGKIALVSNNILLPSSPCSLGQASLVDLIGYGTQVPLTGCWETLPAGATAPTQAATTSSQRKGLGCQDSGDNGADVSTLAVSPRNKISPAFVCSVSVNERNVTQELDFCNLQFPASMSVQASTLSPLIFAQAFESGVTDPAGPAVGLVAQIGYGPIISNPENQGGWTWSAATFNTNAGNNDEWQGQFTAPATPGNYVFTSRFSFDGIQWTYCDINGAGSNVGQIFEVIQLGTLTVTP